MKSSRTDLIDEFEDIGTEASEQTQIDDQNNTEEQPNRFGAAFAKSKPARIKRTAYAPRQLAVLHIKRFFEQSHFAGFEFRSVEKSEKLHEQNISDNIVFFTFRDYATHTYIHAFYPTRDSDEISGNEDTTGLDLALQAFKNSQWGKDHYETHKLIIPLATTQMFTETKIKRKHWLELYIEIRPDQKTAKLTDSQKPIFTYPTGYIKDVLLACLGIKFDENDPKHYEKLGHQSFENATDCGPFFLANSYYSYEGGRGPRTKEISEDLYIQNHNAYHNWSKEHVGTEVDNLGNVKCVIPHGKHTFDSTHRFVNTSVTQNPNNNNQSSTKKNEHVLTIDSVNQPLMQNNNDAAQDDKIFKELATLDPLDIDELTRLIQLDKTDPKQCQEDINNIRVLKEIIQNIPSYLIDTETKNSWSNHPLKYKNEIIEFFRARVDESPLSLEVKESWKVNPLLFTEQILKVALLPKIIMSRVDRLQKFCDAYVKFNRAKRSCFNLFPKHGDEGIERAMEHTKVFKDYFAEQIPIKLAAKLGTLNNIPEEKIDEVLYSILQDLLLTAKNNMVEVRKNRSGLSEHSYTIYLLRFVVELENDLDLFKNDTRLLKGEEERALVFQVLPEKKLSEQYEKYEKEVMGILSKKEPLKIMGPGKK